MDRQFTNKEELEYPTEDDFVDVKVLNNNTKILSEKKANIDSLLDVARESSPKAIENAVKNIRNDISQNLQGVAKEHSEYSIENKIDKIDKFYNNLSLIKVSKEGRSFNTGSEVLIASVNGSGILLASFLELKFSPLQSNNFSDTKFLKLRIEIDGQNIFNSNLIATNQLSKNIKGFGVYTRSNILQYNNYVGKLHYPQIFYPISNVNGEDVLLSLSNNNEILPPLDFNQIGHIFSKEQNFMMNSVIAESIVGAFESGCIKYNRSLKVYFTLFDKVNVNNIIFKTIYKPN